MVSAVCRRGIGSSRRRGIGTCLNTTDCDVFINSNGCQHDADQCQAGTNVDCRSDFVGLLVAIVDFALLSLAFVVTSAI